MGLTILSAVLSSCEKDKTIPEDIISDNNTYENKEQMTVLGEKLENPYTVTNMQSAFDNLKSSGSEVSEIDIETTHYYIRFLPKNEEEFDLLKQDTTLILYDIPLDYEIKDPGIYLYDNHN